jgi:hypothetical protein
MAPPLTILSSFGPSDVRSRPSSFMTVPDGCKLLGGGAIIDPVQPSNFLTASYPIDPITWFAAGKDHEISSPASITAIAYGILDEDNIWDVQIFGAASAEVSHPKVTVYVPGDYVLAGGGAFVDYRGAGNMLNASFPVQPLGNGDWYAWEAHSKDHQISDPSVLRVYAIGIRLRSAPFGSPGVQNQVKLEISQPADKPEVLTSFLDFPFQVTGGGAFDRYGNGAGNMLTASGPALLDQPQSPWRARGSDHRVASPAPINSWVIGLALQPDSVAEVARLRDRYKARTYDGLQHRRSRDYGDRMK